VLWPLHVLQILLGLSNCPFCKNCSGLAIARFAEIARALAIARFAEIARALAIARFAKNYPLTKKYFHFPRKSIFSNNVDACSRGSPLLSPKKGYKENPC